MLIFFIFASLFFVNFAYSQTIQNDTCAIAFSPIGFGSLTCSGKCVDAKKACTFFKGSMAVGANPMDTCVCACNQTEKKACLANGSTWNDTTCSCEEANCSFSLTAGPSTSPVSGCFGKCENPKQSCIFKSNPSSPISLPGCSCSCPFAMSCNPPKEYDNLNCMCACPGNSTIINIGGEIDVGNGFRIRLADISVATGSSNSHPAIFDVLDENGNVIGQITVGEGESYAFTAPDGRSFTIRVTKTAGGLTLSAKWVEVAARKACVPPKIWSDEICDCACKSEDKAACASQGGVWDDRYCFCNLSCHVDANSNSCIGKCDNPNKNCMIVQMHTLTSLAQMTVDACDCICNQSKRADCINKSGIWNDTECSCKLPELLCSRAQKYENGTCGKDDCVSALGADYFCNATECKCEKKPVAQTCTTSKYPDCEAQDCPQADLNNGLGKADQKCEPYNGKCACVCTSPNYVCIGNGKKTCCTPDRKCCNGVCCEPGLDCVSGVCKKPDIKKTCSSSYPSCNVNDCPSGYQCTNYNGQCVCVNTQGPCVWQSNPSSPDSGDCFGSCSAGRTCSKRAGWQSLPTSQRCECAPPPMAPLPACAGTPMQLEACPTFFPGISIGDMQILPPLYSQCKLGFSCNINSGMCIPDYAKDYSGVVMSCSGACPDGLECTSSDGSCSCLIPGGSAQTLPGPSFGYWFQ